MLAIDIGPNCTATYENLEQDEIRLLFTKTFSDSEGRAEGEVIGGLVFDLMTETKKDDILGFAAAEHVSVDLIRVPFELSQPEGWLCRSLDGSEIEALSGSPRCVKALSHFDYW